MKSIKTILWVMVMAIGPWALILLLAGFSPAMQSYYSMDWLEIGDERRDVRLPRSFRLDLCSTVGCQKRTRVNITKANLEKVRELMMSTDAVSERRGIARTISYLEKLTCKRVGVCDDKPNPSFFTKGQMDCVDEATNTTSYLLWLKSHGLLKFHVVSVPQVRGFPVAHWFPVIKVLGSIPKNSDRGQCIVESDFNFTGQEPVITCGRF